MVKILRLTYINFKLSIKDFASILTMIIAPLALILGLNFIGNKGGYVVDTNIAFNIQDKGVYGEEILKDMNIGDYIFYDEEDKALELLHRNEVIAVYQIPEDFTEKITNGEKPNIKAFKRQEGNTTLAFELRLEEEINNKVKRQILIKEGIVNNDELLDYGAKAEVYTSKGSKLDKGFILAMTMSIYFIILSSSVIGEKMVSMKKQNILSRAMSTANRGYEILGSLCLSILALHVIANLIVVIISKFIINFTIPSFSIVIVNIVLASLFSITFTMFMTRIFENQGVVSFVAVIFSIANIFLSLIASESSSFSKIPFAVRNLGKFTPFYWLMDSVENLKLFPNALVVLLMILALFSGGNYKLKNFINKV